MSMADGLYLAYLALYLCSLPFLVSTLLTSLAAIVFWKSTLKEKPADLQRERQGPRFLIVIPAQNEQANILETVRSCLAVDYPRELFDVLVIADNCTDGTALLARDAGAQSARAVR